MLRTSVVDFFVPAWEGSEEDETDEGEDYGDDAGIWLAGTFRWRGGGEGKSDREGAYIRYGKTILSLKVLATHIKFNGSWSTETWAASAEALLEQRKEPPSGLMQMPKYPTLTSNCARPTIFAMAVVTPGSTCAGSNVGG